MVCNQIFINSITSLIHIFINTFKVCNKYSKVLDMC